MSAPRLQVHSHTSTTWDVTYDGKRARLAFSSKTPDEIRAHADAEIERAREILWRAERAHAIADHWAAERTVAAARARLQARERAARTRERNRDPFGFQAMQASQ